MNRRQLLGGAVAAAGAAALPVSRRPAQAAAPSPMKITRVRFYENPRSKEIINQSFHVVTVETDAGITGIGEGGSRELVEQCGAMLIGEDPARIDRLWQMMYRGLFYPAGREKLHALGALDLALWDIKGKALGVPVYELIGGLSRDHVLVYSTGFPVGKSLRDKARACVEAGFAAFRMSPSDGDKARGFDARDVVRITAKNCAEVRAGVGPDGDWCIDFHTRFDLPDAVRLCKLIEELEPFFVEDPIRSENPAVYRTLRPQVKVPLALGEQFGDRWDVNDLVEQHLMDYSRVTLPNCGGITEFLKIAALCETHYVGLTPHFTGPIAEAALVHCCAVFPGPVMMELTNGGQMDKPHLPESYDLKNGKLFPNRRPGLGITLDTKPLKLVLEVTERPPTSGPRNWNNKLLRRPDGSFTNW